MKKTTKRKNKTTASKAARKHKVLPFKVKVKSTNRKPLKTSKKPMFPDTGVVRSKTSNLPFVNVFQRGDYDQKAKASST